MENTARKKTEEVLAEIYRNCQLALQSISNILPAVEDETLKNELTLEHEEYERFSAKAVMLAKNKGIELKEPNPFKKAMMWGSIKMNTLMNNAPEHIADMMIQGTVMGITALRTTASEVYDNGDPEIRELLDELIRTEEEFEKKWKAYL
ncbi:MAG: hypothetical protein J6A38_04250 [Clostridia bacterium]|nr:hypothetical protein [Clostridia bacterium]